MHRYQLEDEEELKQYFFPNMGKNGKILLSIMNGYDTCCAFN